MSRLSIRSPTTPQRILERDAELLVGHDALELLAGRLGSVVGHHGEAAGEAVPGAERAARARPGCRGVARRSRLRCRRTCCFTYQRTTRYGTTAREEPPPAPSATARTTPRGSRRADRADEEHGRRDADVTDLAHLAERPQAPPRAASSDCSIRSSRAARSSRALPARRARRPRRTSTSARAGSLPRLDDRADGPDEQADDRHDDEEQEEPATGSACRGTTCSSGSIGEAERAASCTTWSTAGVAGDPHGDVDRPSRAPRASGRAGGTRSRA